MDGCMCMHVNRTALQKSRICLARLEGCCSWLCGQHVSILEVKTCKTWMGEPTFLDQFQTSKVPTCIRIIISWFTSLSCLLQGLFFKMGGLVGNIAVKPFGFIKQFYRQEHLVENKGIFRKWNIFIQHTSILEDRIFLWDGAKIWMAF